jgi:NTP pyrophosphatase (non-canonical NTP hydrolase)
MSDSTTTVHELRELVRVFVEERDWRQFHSPKNLSMALAIEAAELMEHFQWIGIDASRDLASDPEKRAAAGEELADVIAYGLALASPTRSATRCRRTFASIQRKNSAAGGGAMTRAARREGSPANDRRSGSWGGLRELRLLAPAHGPRRSRRIALATRS